MVLWSPCFFHSTVWKRSTADELIRLELFAEFVVIKTDSVSLKRRRGCYNNSAAWMLKSTWNVHSFHSVEGGHYARRYDGRLITRVFFLFQNRQLAARCCLPTMTTAYRNKVLSLYREIFRLARGWQSTTGHHRETEEEKKYIIGEAKELFRKNRNVWIILCSYELMNIFFSRLHHSVIIEGVR